MNRHATLLGGGAVALMGVVTAASLADMDTSEEPRRPFDVVIDA